ncbi:MBL fold metallo-hydrolase, partial [Bacillus paranthracis]|nr:MBL fold metallo-hydrolase [Bacillus paranthracis]
MFFLVSVLLCFSLNSSSSKRYMMAIHTASPFHMQRQHFGTLPVSFSPVGQGADPPIILPTGPPMLIAGGPY